MSVCRPSRVSVGRERSAGVSVVACGSFLYCTYIVRVLVSIVVGYFSLPKTMAECLPSTSDGDGDGDIAASRVKKMIEEMTLSVDRLAQTTGLDKIKEYLLSNPIYQPIFQHPEQVDGMCTILDRKYDRIIFFLPSDKVWPEQHD